MNRNRVSDGGQARTASDRRTTTTTTQAKARAEVIYVGRSSFWNDRDGQRFQEMPESPWVAKDVAAPSGSPTRSGVVRAAGVPAPIPPASSGATVILGINLSGPIVLEPEPSEVPVRLDDSSATVLPAGEMSLPYVPRSVGSSFPSSVTALMTAAVIAFSVGLMMSPLGGRLISRAGGASPAATAAIPTVSPVRAVAVSPLPLIVPTSSPVSSPTKPMPSPIARAAVLRASRGNAKDRASGKRGASRRAFASASVRVPAGSVRAGFDEGSGEDAEDRPSRKSVEKESFDLTKQGAKASKSAKPWVDPWAD